MTIPGPASSLKVLQDVPLKPYTTFKIGGPARFFCDVTSPEDARDALALARSQSLEIFVLGGGSNILVSDAGFNGLVLHPARTGIDSLEAEPGERGSGTGVRLSAPAGVRWDELVAYTVDRGWWGVENLSHIPGQSGAALVQNIGAYGQQLSDVFEQADVLELATGELRTLSAAECGLGYRRSIFNSTDRGRFLIWNITLRLGASPRPQVGYRDVQAYFAERAHSAPSQRDIRQAIIAIRDSKFPFPREERGGNAGSFFKNPALDSAAWDALEGRVQARFGDSAYVRVSDTRRRLSSAAGAARPVSAALVAVPAALLIDICGLRGYESGRAKVNPSQPLVILNQGGATADDVLRLAGHIRRTVYRETGIALDLEPELVGFSPEEVEGYLGEP